MSELRKTSDGKPRRRARSAATSPRCRRRGWKPPEVFVAKGRDGKTDIWGVIIRPTNFDPAKKYPVIENIYAGPQGSFVPKSFAPTTAMQAQAELGFIVVQIDGMGTSNRSKAFHDVAWKNLGDAGFPGSHPLAQGGRGEVSVLRHHARRHLRHVGRRPERARRAAVPSRVLQGRGVVRRLPRQPDGQDLVERAVDGMVDTNVDPSSTMQVVNALIKANKTFDLLVIPGAEHGAGRGERRLRRSQAPRLLRAAPARPGAARLESAPGARPPGTTTK